MKLHRSPLVRFSAVVALLVVLPLPLARCDEASVTAAKQPADASPPFPRGARCLFIGHSFFVPVARSFDRLARENGFPQHRMQFVFSPGGSGAPGALWNKDRLRERIEQLLRTGEVDLLGMTIGHRDSTFDDYRRWIDLALKYNPKTQFFIGHCWVPGGTRLPTRTFQRLIDQSGQRVFQIVRRLRQAYPRTRIHYVNYGVVAALMKADFESGRLNDIRELVGRGRDALFRDDRLGHAGPMLLDVCAATWLKALYGADPGQLKGLAYDAEDLQRIITAAIRANAAYGSSADSREGNS